VTTATAPLPLLVTVPPEGLHIVTMRKPRLPESDVVAWNVLEPHGGNGPYSKGDFVAHIALFTSALALGLLAAQTVAAQNYPSKPIRLVVGFTAGGGADLIARLLAKQLSASMGQSVVVENRPGASGNLAAEIVAKSTPDGHTLLYGNSSISIAPALYAKLGYDPINDLAAISMAAAYPYVLASHPSLPVRSVKELIALAKAKPGALDYASGGDGTTGHLAMELTRLKTGINVVHIPYKGGGPALTSLISGETQIGFLLSPIAVPYMKSGRLRALALTDKQRSAVMPDVPTMKEAGVEGNEVLQWNGLFGAARIPESILDRLQREVAAAVDTAEIKQQFSTIGATPVGSTRSEFTAFVREEARRWAEVAKRANVKPQ